MLICYLSVKSVLSISHLLLLFFGKQNGMLVRLSYEFKFSLSALHNPLLQMLSLHQSFGVEAEVVYRVFLVITDMKVCRKTVRWVIHILLFQIFYFCLGGILVLHLYEFTVLI
jgi:hypothetical protein